MTKKNDEIYEVGLSNPDFNILRRSLRSYKNYLVFFFIGLIIAIMINGYDIYLLMAFISLFCLSFLYCVFLHRKVLYKVRYHLSTDMIELLSIRINRVNPELMAKRSEVKVVLKQNFIDRYPVWQVFFYYKGGLIISQRAIDGWSKEMFLEIEKAIKVTNHGL